MDITEMKVMKWTSFLRSFMLLILLSVWPGICSAPYIASEKLFLTLFGGGKNRGYSYSLNLMLQIMNVNF